MLPQSFNLVYRPLLIVDEQVNIKANEHGRAIDLWKPILTS
jgi:hypothetical protein